VLALHVCDLKEGSAVAENSPTVDMLFKLAAENIQSEFEKIRKTMPHHLTSGEEAEDLLSKFLNAHLPRRFAATSGFVIDTDNTLSKQCDVLIYDAENSPIYRAGSRGQILPSDSIASVIEIKSRLNKKELQDASEKIASVKKLKRSAISELDQPVTFSNFIVNSSLGVVFAYESDTSLQTLAENLRELNKTLPRAHWIDTVVVLGKGMISYCIEFPGEKKFRGMIMPPASEDFVIFPCYIHLSIFEDAEYALNRFFLSLMSVLAFYRKKTFVPFDSLLRGAEKTTKTIRGYWYKTDRELVEVPEEQIGKGREPLAIFDVFYQGSNNIIARFKQHEWSDGFIYEVIPPKNDSLAILQLIVKMTQQQPFNVLPTQEGVVAFTSLLKGKPPTMEEIKKHLTKHANVRIEIR
jgi:hypothetical protein